MKIFGTKTETGQMSCNEWDHYQRGTIFTPGRYTASDTFKILNTEEVWCTIFGVKVWRKSFTTDFDEKPWITIKDL